MCRRLVLLLVPLLTAACGLKGDLYLPPPRPQAEAPAPADDPDARERRQPPAPESAP